MFQFPAFPPLARFQEMIPGRFPDLGDLRIKACLAAPRSFSQLSHDLHRLWTPRHPPCTLSSLTTLFLNSFVVGHYIPNSPCFQRTPRVSPRVFPHITLLVIPCGSIQAALGHGGGDRTRTDDFLVANQVLYQLSYAPGQARGLPGAGASARVARSDGGPDWI